MAVLGAVGCGGTEPEPLESPPHHEAQALASDNGLSLNGLSLNGLSLNGLSLNGLSLNGLSEFLFTRWFERDPKVGDEVMRYLIRCAVPEGEERSYTSTTTGRTHTWAGSLGLAPDWAHGAPATVREQQLVSACLLAHVNTYQVSVPISVLGRTAPGAEIPLGPDELELYDRPEACFFGNLFTGEGVYAGNDRTQLSPQESTSRHCALSRTPAGADALCPLVTRVGACEQLSCELDASARYYTRCTYKGVEYAPLTTRLRASHIYRCGDGVCQVSERCGGGSTPNDCGVDCGPCG